MDKVPGMRIRRNPGPHVERAAYYLIAEALANVAKHAAATSCEVILRRGDGALVIEVRDDGAGGAAIVPNGGLAGLADRVEALDGRLSVESPVGGPTIIRAELPIPTQMATDPDSRPVPGPSASGGDEG